MAQWAPPRYANASFHSFNVTVGGLYQSINQSRFNIFSSVTQQKIVLKCAHVVEKKGISDKTIYVETRVN